MDAVSEAVFAISDNPKYESQRIHVVLHGRLSRSALREGGADEASGLPARDETLADSSLELAL